MGDHAVAARGTAAPRRGGPLAGGAPGAPEVLGAADATPDLVRAEVRGDAPMRVAAWWDWAGGAVHAALLEGEAPSAARVERASLWCAGTQENG